MFFLCVAHFFESHLHLHSSAIVMALLYQCYMLHILNLPRAQELQPILFKAILDF